MKTAKIRISYDATLVVPTQHLQKVLDALALGILCEVQYPVREPVLVRKEEEEVEIKLGDFKVFTKEEVQAMRE